MRRSPLLFIFILVFVDLMGYGMILPLLPFYVQRQEAGAAAAGLAGALYAFMQLFSGPVLGSLSDRYGRRPVLLVCLLGTASASTLLGLANSLPMIYLAVALDGITGGNLTTAYAYIADVTPPEKRSRGMGLVGAAFGLGMMAGPALGGLFSRFGLSTPAFLAALIALGNAIYGGFVLPESLPPDRRTIAFSFRSLNPVGQLKDLFHIAPIRLLLASMFALNLAFSGLQTNFPLYSQKLFGWSSFQNGVFYAYVGVCAVFVQGVLYGRIQPRVGERRLIWLGLACMALGLGGMALARQSWQLYPLVGITAFGSGVSIPSLGGLISNRVSPAGQGRLMGGTQALLSATLILGPLIAGGSFEYVGVQAPYWLGSLFSTAALVLAGLGLRGNSPKQQSSMGIKGETLGRSPYEINEQR